MTAALHCIREDMANAMPGAKTEYKAIEQHVDDGEERRGMLRGETIEMSER